jgi:hypothetical protein
LLDLFDLMRFCFGTAFALSPLCCTLQSGEETEMKLDILLSLTLAILLALPHASFAQQTPDAAAAPWAGVKLVPPGDELVVNLKDGKTVNGRLVSASDKMLVISHGDKTAALDQGDVQKVYRKVPRSGLSRTQIGTLVGLAAGAAIGGGLSSSNDFEAGWAVSIFALIGAGIGAIVGSISGSGRVKVLIYDAK